MRKLDEKELELVQQAISLKNIGLVELLAEIYDHYLSHLEQASPDDFNQELNTLEEKFTLKYCKKLEQDLMQISNKEIFQLTCSQIVQLFTWPKAIVTTVLLISVAAIWPSLPKNVQFILLMILLTNAAISIGRIWWHSHKKIKFFKSFYKYDGFLISKHSSSVMLQIHVPFSTFNLFVTLPKVLEIYNVVDTPYFMLVSLFFFLMWTLITISTLKAWKIISKTALI